MTDILPPAGWPNVRQLETNEFATGGANGNMNEQAKSLAARSELLKQYAALPYESKTGGYALNERVQLATGDIVKSTEPNNTNNPNIDMTGWVKEKAASQIFDESGLSQQEVNDKYRDRTSKTFYAVDYGFLTTNTAEQNTIALQALSAAVNANNGGHVVFQGGDFQIGHQVLAGTDPAPYSWGFSELLYIHNCSNPLLLEFNQTILKFADGLHHGAFDPITGNPVAGPTSEQKYHAGIGRAIELRANADVRMIGQLRVNLNGPNTIVGGLFGDLGRQCISYGLYAIGNKVFTSDGAFVFHDSPLDGFYNSSLNEIDSLHQLNGIVSMRNSRQALSLVGGWNQYYTGCYFGKTGMGVFPSSAPAANLDLEAEITNDINSVVFTSCIFSDAVGGSIISEFPSARKVKFNECIVENSMNVAVYCKSNLEFNGGQINGKIEPFYSLDHENPATMRNVTISQRMQDGTLAYRSGALLSDGGASSTFTSLDKITISYDFDIANGASAFYLASSGRSGEITLNVKGNPANLATRSFGSLVGNMKIERLTVNNRSAYTGALPDERKEISGGGLTYVDAGFITNDASNQETILWQNGFFSSGGRSGWWSGGNIDTEANPLQPKELSVLKNGYGPSGYYGGQVIKSTTTGVPTSGYYKLGTWIINGSPAVGQPMGWVCTVEGTAGADAVFSKMPNLLA